MNLQGRQWFLTAASLAELIVFCFQVVDRPEYGIELLRYHRVP